MNKVSLKDFGILALIYLGVLVLQFLGAMYTIESIPNWYVYLNKPFFNPPNYVFGPVWTVLYLLMSVSIWMVYLSKGKAQLKRICYWIFALQMVVNFLWTILFFLVRSPLLAFVDIIGLVILITLNILCFYQVNKKAAFLMVPYLLWVIFAAVLNFSVVLLN